MPTPWLDESEKYTMAYHAAHFFSMNNIIIVNYGKAIGPHGIALYAFFACCATYEEGNFDTKDIGLTLGMTDTEVQNAFACLVAHDLMAITPRNNPEGDATYTLVDLYSRTAKVLPPPRPAPPVATMPSHPGFVYVVEGGGYFKIGYTSNPAKRISALNVKAPFKLKAHMLIPTENMGHLEAVLHLRFAPKHVRGEWFSLTQEDLDALAQQYETIDPAQLATS